MSHRLIAGVLVTLATLAVCYVGVRSEWARAPAAIDAEVPQTPTTADAARTDPTGGEQPTGT
jgi:hypothetical protein